MVEVPALALAAGRPCLKRVDFLSIGSNDLFQFLFACDRGNPRLADRYDALSPAMLELLRRLVARCRRGRRAAQPLRRDGGRPVRGDGADRPRLPHPVDGAACDRPGAAMIRSLDLARLHPM